MNNKKITSRMSDADIIREIFSTAKDLVRAGYGDVWFICSRHSDPLAKTVDGNKSACQRKEFNGH